VSGKEAVARIEGREAFSNTVCVAECATRSGLCLVVDGIDPATSHRHRETWVFMASDGCVDRIVKTTSPSLPQARHDR